MEEKITIEFDSSGESGNIFYILMMMNNEFKRLNVKHDYKDLMKRIVRSRNY